MGGQELSLTAIMIIFIPVFFIIALLCEYTQFLKWAPSHFPLACVIIAIIVTPFTIVGILFDHKRKKNWVSNNE
ncbi:hypothetical protein [Bacillus subtilis]|uniref:hypothetical protein n=1 Tax=Bacillus subtilis TaxID=1423 RepID=UPI000F531117|nr:hypothetical protein [Bacillus subtilis]MEC2297167.1 hypothetical protein [Bacillus subtilis]GLI90711.1 hypothetical protein ANABIO4_40630 [Bacillus subtilis]